MGRAAGLTANARGKARGRGCEARQSVLPVPVGSPPLVTPALLTCTARRQVCCVPRECLGVGLVSVVHAHVDGGRVAVAACRMESGACVDGQRSLVRTLSVLSGQQCKPRPTAPSRLLALTGGVVHGVERARAARAGRCGGVCRRRGVVSGGHQAPRRNVGCCCGAVQAL